MRITKNDLVYAEWCLSNLCLKLEKWCDFDYKPWIQTNLAEYFKYKIRNKKAIKGAKSRMFVIGVVNKRKITNRSVHTF